MNHSILLYPSLRVATSLRHTLLSISPTPRTFRPSLRTARTTHSPPRYTVNTHLPHRYYATMTSEEATGTTTIATPVASAPTETAPLQQPVAHDNAAATPSRRPGKVVLAPMVRTGELPTRLLALKYGADLVWGPETVDRAIIGCERIENTKIGCVDFWKGPRLIYRTCPAREKSQLIFQIGTASADLAVEAAKVVARDVSGIDLNAGCPKHFSVHAGMGAGLLKNPQNLLAILNALVANVGLSTSYALPISVKIRLLDTVEASHALISDLVKTGISKLTLHCRTTPMRPRERAIRDALAGAAKICKDAGVEFFVNGDVENRDHAHKLIREYEINGGAMIALAAESNPSVFLSEEEGEGLKDWKEVVIDFVQTAMSVDNAFSNTKFCILHIVPGKQPEYQLLSRTKTYRDICEVLGIECVISEEKDIGTTKTQKQKAIEAREAEAKKEKEERLKKKAEMKRKRDNTEEPAVAVKEIEETGKRVKVDVNGDAGMDLSAVTAPAVSSVEAGAAI